MLASTRWILLLLVLSASAASTAVSLPQGQTNQSNLPVPIDMLRDHTPSFQDSQDPCIAGTNTAKKIAKSIASFIVATGSDFKTGVDKGNNWLSSVNEEAIDKKCALKSFSLYYQIYFDRFTKEKTLKDEAHLNCKLREEFKQLKALRLKILSHAKIMESQERKVGDLRTQYELLSIFENGTQLEKRIAKEEKTMNSMYMALKSLNMNLISVAKSVKSRAKASIKFIEDRLKGLEKRIASYSKNIAAYENALTSTKDKTAKIHDLMLKSHEELKISELNNQVQWAKKGILKANQRITIARLSLQHKLKFLENGRREFHLGTIENSRVDLLIKELVIRQNIESLDQKSVKFLKIREGIKKRIVGIKRQETGLLHDQTEEKDPLKQDVIKKKITEAKELEVKLKAQVEELNLKLDRMRKEIRRLSGDLRREALEQLEVEKSKVANLKKIERSEVDKREQAAMKLIELRKQLVATTCENEAKELRESIDAVKELQDSYTESLTLTRKRLTAAINDLDIARLIFDRTQTALRSAKWSIYGDKDLSLEALVRREKRKLRREKRIYDKIVKESGTFSDEIKSISSIQHEVHDHDKQEKLANNIASLKSKLAIKERALIPAKKRVDILRKSVGKLVMKLKDFLSKSGGNTTNPFECQCKLNKALEKKIVLQKRNRHLFKSRIARARKLARAERHAIDKLKLRLRRNISSDERSQIEIKISEHKAMFKKFNNKATRMLYKLKGIDKKLNSEQGALKKAKAKLAEMKNKTAMAKMLKGFSIGKDKELDAARHLMHKQYRKLKELLHQSNHLQTKIHDLKHKTKFFNKKLKFITNKDHEKQTKEDIEEFKLTTKRFSSRHEDLEELVRTELRTLLNMRVRVRHLTEGLIRRESRSQDKAKSQLVLAKKLAKRYLKEIESKRKQLQCTCSQEAHLQAKLKNELNGHWDLYNKNQLTLKKRELLVSRLGGFLKKLKHQVRVLRREEYLLIHKGIQLAKLKIERLTCEESSLNKENEETKLRLHREENPSKKEEASGRLLEIENKLESIKQSKAFEERVLERFEQDQRDHDDSKIRLVEGHVKRWTFKLHQERQKEKELNLKIHNLKLLLNAAKCCMKKRILNLRISKIVILAKQLKRRISRLETKISVDRMELKTMDHENSRNEENQRILVFNLKSNILKAKHHVEEAIAEEKELKRKFIGKKARLTCIGSKDEDLYKFMTEKLKEAEVKFYKGTQMIETRKHQVTRAIRRLHKTQIKLRRIIQSKMKFLNNKIYDLQFQENDIDKDSKESLQKIKKFEGELKRIKNPVLRTEMIQDVRESKKNLREAKARVSSIRGWIRNYKRELKEEIEKLSKLGKDLQETEKELELDEKASNIASVHTLTAKDSHTAAKDLKKSSLKLMKIKAEMAALKKQLKNAKTPKERAAILKKLRQKQNESKKLSKKIRSQKRMLRFVKSKEKRKEKMLKKRLVELKSLIEELHQKKQELEKIITRLLKDLSKEKDIKKRIKLEEEIKHRRRELDIVVRQLRGTEAKRNAAGRRLKKIVLRKKMRAMQARSYKKRMLKNLKSSKMTKKTLIKKIHTLKAGLKGSKDSVSKRKLKKELISTKKKMSGLKKNMKRVSKKLLKYKKIIKSGSKRERKELIKRKKTISKQIKSGEKRMKKIGKSIKTLRKSRSVTVSHVKKEMIDQRIKRKLKEKKMISKKVKSEKSKLSKLNLKHKKVLKKLKKGIEKSIYKKELKSSKLERKLDLIKQQLKQAKTPEERAKLKKRLLKMKKAIKKIQKTIRHSEKHVHKIERKISKVDKKISPKVKARLLKKHSKALKSKIAKLRSREKELTKKINELREKLAHETDPSEKAKLRKELAESLAAAKKVKGMIASLEKNFQATDATLSSLESKIEEMIKNQLKKIEAKLQKKAAKGSKLKETLSNIKMRKQRYDEKVKQLKDAISHEKDPPRKKELEGELAGVNQTEAEFKKIIAKLNGKVGLSNKELDETSAVISRLLSKQEKVISQRLGRKAHETKFLKGYIQKMLKKKDQLHKKVSEVSELLKTESDPAKRKELDAALKQLQNASKTVTKKITDSEHRLGITQSELLKVSKEIEDIVAQQVKLIDAKLQRLKGKRSNLSEALKRLRAKQISLRKLITEAKQKLSSAKTPAEKAKLAGDISEMEKADTEITTIINQLVPQINITEEELIKIEKKAGDLISKQIALNSNTINSLGDTKSLLEQTLRTVVARKKAFEKRIVQDTEIAKAETDPKNIQDIKKEIEGAKKIIPEVENQIKMTRNNLKLTKEQIKKFKESVMKLIELKDKNLSERLKMIGARTKMLNKKVKVLKSSLKRTTKKSTKKSISKKISSLKEKIAKSSKSVSSLKSSKKSISKLKKQVKSSSSKIHVTHRNFREVGAVSKKKKCACCSKYTEKREMEIKEMEERIKQLLGCRRGRIEDFSEEVKMLREKIDRLKSANKALDKHHDEFIHKLSPRVVLARGQGKVESKNQNRDSEKEDLIKALELKKGRKLTDTEKLTLEYFNQHRNLHLATMSDEESHLHMKKTLLI
jgi:chromosome segregation ATPase